MSSSHPKVAILTLGKHQDNPNAKWITVLVARLLSRHPHLSVTVVGVDNASFGLVGADTRPPWDLIVNRVDDSAGPTVQKAGEALLRAAELHGIPVINGTKTWSVGANKWLHHQVLGLAGLRTPRSVIVRGGGGNGSGGGGGGGGRGSSFQDIVAAAAESLLERGASWPLLVKPNAGGFGKGIVFVDDAEALTAWAAGYVTGAPSEKLVDDTMLLQEYTPPIDGCMYRVWFLRDVATNAGEGRGETVIQCAVKRRVETQGGDSNAPATSVFTQGCVASKGGGEVKSAAAGSDPTSSSSSSSSSLSSLEESAIAAGASVLSGREWSSLRDQASEGDRKVATAVTGGGGGAGEKKKKRKRPAGGEGAAAVVAAEEKKVDIGDNESSSSSSSSSSFEFTAWAVPTGIREAIERVVAVTDANCGSIEFLYPTPSDNNDGNDEAAAAALPEPLYFDVNMVSSLPQLGGLIGDPDQVRSHPLYTAVACIV